MAYLLTASKEQKEQRSETMHVYGRMLTRVFHVNKNQVDNVKPARGDLLVGWEGDATGLARPRVTSYSYRDNTGGGADEIIVQSIEPVPYSTETANVMELNGSQTPTDNNTDYSDMKTIHVSATADHASVPTEGDLYPGDTAISGRYCMQTQIDKDTVPGLFFVTAMWRQYNPVTGGSATAVVMELAASRSPLDGNAMFTEMKTSYLATNPDGTGLPQEGDLYTGDTAIVGKYCIGKQESKHGLTGLFFVTATWRQYRLMTDGETSGTTWYEVLGRSIGQTSSTRFIGSQAVICADANSATVVSSLYLHSHPRQALAKARRPIAEESAHGMLGVCLIRLGYDSTERYYVRKDNYARIVTATTATAEASLFDTEENQITGPIDNLGNFKYIVAGTNPLKYRMDVRVSAAASYATFNHATYRDMQGKVNSGTMTNIGGAAPGTLLLNKVHTQYQFGDDLVYLDYFFTYNAAGWNSAKVQIGSNQLVEKKSAGGTSKLVMMRVLGKQVDADGVSTTTEPTDIVPYEEDSFSTLNGYIYW